MNIKRVNRGYDFNVDVKGIKFAVEVKSIQFQKEQKYFKLKFSRRFLKEALKNQRVPIILLIDHDVVRLLEYYRDVIKQNLGLVKESIKDHKDAGFTLTK